MKNKMKNNFEFFSKLQLFLFKHKFLGIIKYIFYFMDRIICLFIRKSKEINKKKQVVILANLGLGDAMNFLSVTDKYRKLYAKEDYEITLIVSSGLYKLFEEETEFDYIYSTDFNGITLNFKKRIDFFKFINNKNYDLLIEIMGPNGCSPSIYISRASRAAKKVTLKNLANSFCPDFIVKKSFTNVYEINDNKISNIDYYNKLYNLLAGNNKKYNIQYHKTKKYKIHFDVPKKYYIVFPSASAEVKKWPLDRYAEIIKRVYKKTQLPVLFCGTKIDGDSVNQLIKLIGNIPHYDYVGKTDVLEFIELIKNAQFVLTNDTSSYHIAVSEEVPTAIIVGGYTYDSFVLYDFYNNKYKKPYPIVNKRDCFNCRSHCPYIENKKIWPCLDAITVDYAWKIIDSMIDKELK